LSDIDLGGLYASVIEGLNIFINSIIGYIDLGGPPAPVIGGLNNFADSILGYVDL
jgi:hypothetical protein